MSASTAQSKVYLTGRYVKLRRDISQTPFTTPDGRAIAETSVEVIIVEAVERALSAEGFKFIPAGREDMDVRMLEEGRPFVLEICNPNIELSSTLIDQLTVETSYPEKGVVVHDWRIAKRDAVLIMKTGEEAMRKHYRCLVWISRDLTEGDLDLLNHLKGVTVSQQTPLRVAHRRANATRDKTVHWMKAAAIQGTPRYFTLELCTSAGCYIKEFIHGDFGRTFPSLYDLLQVDHTQCCALDVTRVEMEISTPEESSPLAKRSSANESVVQNVRSFTATTPDAKKQKRDVTSNADL